MNIDLSKCRKGQKLLLRNGEQATYVSKDASIDYPHNVRLPCSSILGYTNAGHYNDYIGEHSYDVTKIIIKRKKRISSTPKVVQANVKVPLKILLKKRGDKYQYKVISQPESFRCPKGQDEISFAASNGFKLFSCQYPAITDEGTSIYLRGEWRDHDTKSQLIELSHDQAQLIRESVNLFNKEYIPESPQQTLEQITAEYSNSQDKALKVFKHKASQLLDSLKKK
jgi:hypothetical protein